MTPRLPPPADPAESGPAADSSADFKTGTVSNPEPSSNQPVAPVPEIGGRKDGTEPTRFGDWEKGGRCIDF